MHIVGYLAALGFGIAAIGSGIGVGIIVGKTIGPSPVSPSSRGASPR